MDVDDDTCRLIEATAVGVAWMHCRRLEFTHSETLAALSRRHGRFTRAEIELLADAAAEADKRARANLAQAELARASADAALSRLAGRKP